jgi:hypothetical protein
MLLQEDSGPVSLSSTRNAINKRESRKRNSIKKGNEPGVSHAPFYLNEEEKVGLIEKISENIHSCKYHTLEWLLSIVCICFTGYLFYLLQSQDLRNSRPTEPGEDVVIVDKPGNQWGKKFIKEKTTFRFRKAKMVDKARISATCKEYLRPFFSSLAEIMDKNNYMKELIYNIDETSLMVKKPIVPILIQDPSLPQALSCKPPKMSTSTAVLTVCADGTHLSTGVIFNKDIPIETFSHHIASGFKYYNAGKGYMTSQIFQLYMIDTILPEIKEKRVHNYFILFIFFIFYLFIVCLFYISLYAGKNRERVWCR